MKDNVYTRKAIFCFLAIYVSFVRPPLFLHRSVLIHPVFGQSSFLGDNLWKHGNIEQWILGYIRMGNEYHSHNKKWLTYPNSKYLPVVFVTGFSQSEAVVMFHQAY